MSFAAFFKSSVDDVIGQIVQVSPTPFIVSPDPLFFYRGGSRIKLPPRPGGPLLAPSDDGLSMPIPNFPGDGPQRKIFVDFPAIDELVPADASWKVKLQLHHALSHLAFEDWMSPYVYCGFHIYLSLGSYFGLAECIEAWVKGTTDNRELTASFKGSSDYIVFEFPQGEYCVFLRTDFVRKRLAEIAEDDAHKAADAARLTEHQLKLEDERQALADLEELRKSGFDTCVYLMEDIRNGAFKIGRSKTPHKRERTLQSEVPEIVLRFAIPADEQDEQRLHAHFDPQRRRGEWFTLAADELLWIVSFLKKRGDVSRVSVDYEWLGTITFQASANSEGQEL